MKYRKLPSGLQVSEIGFGMWTVSTGWWGNYSDGEAVRLLREAFNLGITLFDAADTYGNGRSENLIRQAFGTEREQIVIATKVGYNFLEHGNDRRGQRAIPQDFRAEAIRQATDAALCRLGTETIDILQLHNIHMEQVRDDELWETLEDLRSQGKIRLYGVSLGPAIGWLAEGVLAIQRRNPAVIQHIYNILEQYPGSTIHRAAQDGNAQTRFFIRVPHSSGMLEGHYTEETVFQPGDHRSHRPRSWLVNGIKKVEQLRFLELENRTLAQAALLWLLAEDRVASTLPNIYNIDQLREFATAPDSPSLTIEELKCIQNLSTTNFGLEPEPVIFKGTMETIPVA